jgi:hypothetical protein
VSVSKNSGTDINQTSFVIATIYRALLRGELWGGVPTRNHGKAADNFGVGFLQERIT